MFSLLSLRLLLVILAYLEELLGNVVVCALGEVAASHVVATAKMDTKMHVCRAFKAGIVELDISIEHLICGLGVALVRLPALEHRL